MMDSEMNVLAIETPMNLIEIHDQMKQNDGNVQGIVAVPLSVILFDAVPSFKSSQEAFNDFVSNKLIGSDLLSDISYEMIGVDSKNDLIYFNVSGDPSDYLSKVFEHFHFYGIKMNSTKNE